MGFLSARSAESSALYRSPKIIRLLESSSSLVEVTVSKVFEKTPFDAMEAFKDLWVSKQEGDVLFPRNTYTETQH
jgi:hypothetical protein